MSWPLAGCVSLTQNTVFVCAQLVLCNHLKYVYTIYVYKYSSVYLPPHSHLAQPQENRSQIEVKLERSLSQRPTRNELIQRHIMVDRRQWDKEMEDRRVSLERKLSRRPTVKELRERRILM